MGLSIKRYVTYSKRIQFRLEPTTGTAPYTDAEKLAAPPRPLTGVAVRAVARETALGPVMVDLDPEITDAANGEITVTITATATGALEPFVGIVDFHEDLTATPGETVIALGRAVIEVVDQTTVFA